jgi:hypothetical protein
MRVSRWMCASLLLACGCGNGGGGGRDSAATAVTAKHTLVLDSGLLAKPAASATRPADSSPTVKEPASASDSTHKQVASSIDTAPGAPPNRQPPAKPAVDVSSGTSGGATPNHETAPVSPVNPTVPTPTPSAPAKPTPNNPTSTNPTPGTTTPGNTTPGNTTPGNTTPGNTTPGNTTPSKPRVPFDYGNRGAGSSVGTSDTAHARGSTTPGTCDTCAATRSGSQRRAGGIGSQTEMRRFNAPTPTRSSATVPVGSATAGTGAARRAVVPAKPNTAPAVATPGALRAKTGVRIDTTRRRPPRNY